MAWRVSEPTRLELGASYTRSRGHVAYKDTYGSIDEDLRIHALFISAGLQRDVIQTDDATLYLCGRVGVLISWLDVSERIVFDRFPEYNSSSDDNGSAYFIAGELDAGVRTRLFGLTVALEGGYRTNLENDKYDFNDNFAGWMIGTRIQIPFGQ